MTSRLKALSSFVALLAIALFSVSTVMAANNVRIVTDLDESRSQLLMGSQTSGAVNFSVNIDALGLRNQTLQEGTFSKLTLPEGEKMVSGMTSDIGNPEMPVLSTLIAIPDNAGIKVSATYDNYEIIENVDVMPMQTPMPESGWDSAVEFDMNMAAYSQDRFLPGTLAEADEPMVFRDVRVAQVSVYPVQYNPVTRQLKIYNNVSVDISYEGEVVNPKTRSAQYLSEAFLPLYKSYIANWDEFYSSFLTSLEVKRGTILMICPDVTGYDWIDEMQEIATWKRQKGYNVVLASTHDVDPSDGRPSTTQVKTFVQNAYNTYDMPPEFLYLIGDEDRVIPQYGYSGYASDHPYSMLDGSDYLPELAVSRVSVDNINELRAWKAKVREYEIDPDVTEDPGYWKRAIMVAGSQQTVTCAWTVLWAKERLHAHGFTQIDTVFDRGSDPPDSRITNPITAGVGYVNYRGWAGSSGWYDPSYNVSSLNQCQNIDKPGIMTSIVCGTGDFEDSYSDPCFGEQWIRMGSATAPRGGPSFFGSTDHNTHTRWNNPISFGLYFGLLEQGIYNFGTAVIAGKICQYNNYPRAHSEIQKYFHTYNMLGDPELEMRLMTPRIINVVYPEELEYGINSMEIYVETENVPVAGAYATLILGEGDDEVFFSVAKTDEFGFAILEVPTDTVGDLMFTVSGRDLKPLLDTLTLGHAAQTVTFDYGTVSDTQSGNGDGLAGPNETIQYELALKNFGESATANGVVATIVSLDESKAVVHDFVINYGDLAAGQSIEGPRPFTFTVMPGAIDEDEMLFRLDITADGVSEPWSSFFSVDIAAARFDVSDVEISGNDRLDPGETVEVTVSLENIGQVDASTVNGYLVSHDGLVQVGDLRAVFGNIAVDETGSNSVPFSVTVHEAAFEGRNAPLILELSSTDGARYNIPFNLTIGNMTSNDPTGPDAYGYYIYDDTDAGYPEVPSYDWMEVRTLGDNQYLSDDTKTMEDLPFDFTYFGTTYDRVTICSNGWICMDSTQWVTFRNWEMPSGSYANNMIAGFWDDLGPSGSNNVFTYNDETNHRYIIEWYNVPTRLSSSVHETFQIILYDPEYHPTITGDGMIELIYYDITNNDGGSGENYSTVGYEDSTETIGYSISYSNIMGSGCATLTDHRVYRITTNNGLGGVKGMVSVEESSVNDAMVNISSGPWGMADDNGSFTVRDIPSGTANLTFSKDGWFPQTLSDVTIEADAFTLGQDATLSKCPIPGDLTASENLDDHVTVSWTAVDHADVVGYNVYRSDWSNGIYEKIHDAPITGVSFDDNTTEDNEIYWYYVQAVFQGDGYEAVSLASNADYGSNDDITGVDDNEAVLPAEYNLAQNYPNPFNAQTSISFALPEAGYVSLDVFNVLGQQVKSIYSGYHQAGFASFIWNGTDGSGEPVSSGLYFYRLATDSERMTKRMMLLK